MGMPVARRSRLITAGVALAGVSVSLLVVRANALGSTSVDQVERRRCPQGRHVTVRYRTPPCWSPPLESSASSRADSRGSLVLASNFRSSNCRVTVTDAPTSAQAALNGAPRRLPPTVHSDAATDHHDPTAADDHHHDHDDDAADHHDDASRRSVRTQSELIKERAPSCPVEPDTIPVKGPRIDKVAEAGTATRAMANDADLSARTRRVKNSLERSN